MLAGPARFARMTLFALPFVTVAVISFALFVVGGPRPYAGARIYGGPTEGIQRLSLRIAAVSREDDVEEALLDQRVHVSAELPGGKALDVRAALDNFGMAQVNVPLDAPSSGPIELAVSLDGPRETPLAVGRIELSRRDWLGNARRLGGWLDGRRSGALAVDVAVQRGVLAVPFSDPMLVCARLDDAPAVAAQIHVEGEGLAFSKPRAGALVTADAKGCARFGVSPLEHVVALRAVAEAPTGERGEWYATLPVVPGALHAELAGNRLRIAAPTPRDVAYVALTDGSTRLFGATIPLDSSARGEAMGELAIPLPLSGPLWAIVSTEAPLDSPSTIGWPLTASDAEPTQTFTVSDKLLLDGVRQGFARDRARKSRARLLAGAFSILAAALAIVLLVGSVRATDADIAERLHELGDAEQPQRSLVRRRQLALLVAALCILLGFASVALVVMYRIQ